MGISCFLRGLGQLNVALINESFGVINKQYFKDSFTVECKKSKEGAVWGFFLPATEKPLLVFTFKLDGNKLDWDGRQSDAFVWWCNWICASVIGEQINVKVELDTGSKLKPNFHLRCPSYSDYVDQEASNWKDPEEAKARLLGCAKSENFKK